MGPEESMRIQSNLASTIAMAFDECAPAKAERSYVQPSVAPDNKMAGTLQKGDGSPEQPGRYDQ